MSNVLLRMHDRRAWIVLAILVGCALAPAAWETFASPSSGLHVPAYLVPLLGKFMCFAMVAVALDLIWGFGGILSLSHGVFFALGGYAMGMNLMLEVAGEGVYRSKLPDFMVFLDWKQLPWFWRGFDNFYYAVAMATVVPATVAFVFGFLAFRSRIRGVYFSIMSQAMTYAMMLLFFRNETGLGGNNGLTDFKRIYGYSLQRPGTKVALYAVSVVALALVYLLARFVVTSRAGAVLRAVRDGESKVRFMGFDSLHYKLFVWTLSAAICGLAGALYVPQVGIINPSELSPGASIEMVIWVAVGGRGTLYGAVLGALVVNAAKSFLTAAYPEIWLYVLGASFVLVTLAVPSGIVSVRLRPLWTRLRALRTSQRPTVRLETPLTAAPPNEESL